MSKKIVAGAQAIVLDVKVGNGAFMQELDEAVKLAEMMVEIGKHAGRRVMALISDMNQPLGNAVGNALEVLEAIDTLQGGGPVDLREHCLEVAGHMLMLADKGDDLETTKKLAADSIEDGTAFEKFKSLVEAQGGDVSAVENPDRLPRATLIETVIASQVGFISGISAREIGLTAMTLGAGRSKKGDTIDHAVGVVVHKKVGEKVERGDALFTVHANNEEKRDAAVQRLMQAHSYSDSKVDPLPLFYRKIGP
jgi:pyrimidine-nucleoside phosphorylase